MNFKRATVDPRNPFGSKEGAQEEPLTCFYFLLHFQCVRISVISLMSKEEIPSCPERLVCNYPAPPERARCRSHFHLTSLAAQFEKEKARLVVLPDKYFRNPGWHLRTRALTLAVVARDLQSPSFSAAELSSLQPFGGVVSCVFRDPDEETASAEVCFCLSKGRRAMWPA